VISYGIEYTRAAYPIGDNGIRVGNGYTKNDGMEQPVYYWDPSFTPSGLTFYRGSLFPEWKNSLLSGALSGEALERLEIRGDKVVAEEALLTDMNTRIRDVQVGPDGAVYVLTDSGTGNPNPNTPWTSKLLKLTPK
jgi:glucose/arabinose dehydrogenase